MYPFIESSNFFFLKFLWCLLHSLSSELQELENIHKENVELWVSLLLLNYTTASPLIVLLPGLGIYSSCIPGVFWNAYSSLSCLSSRCWGGWSPPAGQDPVAGARRVWKTPDCRRLQTLVSYCCLGLWLLSMRFQPAHDYSSECASILM